MTQTANICQDGKLEEEKITPLCANCRDDGHCIWQHAADLVDRRTDPAMYQRQLLTACEFFTDSRKGETASGAIYRQRIFEAGVHDLCQGCPSAIEGACGKRKDLDEITRLSSSYGDPGWVHVSVVSCRPKATGLLQISEPRAAPAPEPAAK